MTGGWDPNIKSLNDQPVAAMDISLEMTLGGLLLFEFSNLGFICQEIG